MDENIEEDDKKSSIKLKECPKCKTPIRRNLRYGNMIKQALKDIENVKKQIIGDERRIEELDQSIREGIIKLTMQDRNILKKQMENMAKGPVSVQSFVTVENQIRFLTSLKELNEKYEMNKEIEMVIMVNSAGCHVDIMHLHDFIVRERKYFTKQEVNDILDELDRLKLLLQFLTFIVAKNSLKIVLDDEINENIGQVEQKLMDGKKFDEKRRKFVANFMSVVEKVVPSSGLGVTDDERLQIVKAMDLSKGHWYKCPNGHVYAIGDCGGATVESICPECKATIGGSSHRLRDDNAVATEMDGATHPAWSEQAHMENYDPFEIRY